MPRAVHVGKRAMMQIAGVRSIVGRAFQAIRHSSNSETPQAPPEMVNGRPLFPGDTDANQLQKIFKALSLVFWSRLVWPACMLASETAPAGFSGLQFPGGFGQRSDVESNACAWP